MLRHPERQRTPAAAEFENVLSVGQLRAVARQPEHRLLGGIEGGRALQPERTAVFQSRPEAKLIKPRRHLVMLLVRDLRLDGDRALLQLRNESGQMRLLRADVALIFLAQPFPQ
jgi:hypothetical protein